MGVGEGENFILYLGLFVYYFFLKLSFINKEMINVQFLQKWSLQKPFWDETKLFSLL